MGSDGNVNLVLDTRTSSLHDLHLGSNGDIDLVTDGQKLHGPVTTSRLVPAFSAKSWHKQLFAEHSIHCVHCKAMTSEFMGFFRTDGTRNLADILSTYWAMMAKGLWSPLQSLTFWTGDVVDLVLVSELDTSLKQNGE